LEGLSVSRETLQDLQTFAALVRRWNPKINLTSRGDEKNLWSRHIQDSAQVDQVAPDAVNWIDLGSGGGFPGIVCAILRKYTQTAFQLVEADKRKAVFLQTATATLGLKATVKPQRIEELETTEATVISARALADLDSLLTLSDHLRNNETVHIFPKGRNWKLEVEAARKSWHFDLEVHQSRTSDEAAILELRHVQRV
jgi:16S rRNA (guanine527-N7)-methyltransferase